MTPVWEWIAAYGYLAVFVGCLLEGETLLVIAGIAAHEGKLSLPLVILTAFIAGTLGDQILYWIGRRFGAPVLGKWSSKSQQVRRINHFLERFDAALIFGVRFMYGIRLVGPVVIGASHVQPARFAVLNVLGAAVWAPLVAGTGYVFGHLIEDWLERFNVAALIGAIAAIALVCAAHWWIKKRVSPHDPHEG